MYYVILSLSKDFELKKTQGGRNQIRNITEGQKKF
jgi:hypothetical protein